MRDPSENQSEDYLRGAMHAFTCMGTFGTASRVSASYAARETKRLLDMVSRGAAAPPLIDYMVQLQAGRNPETIIRDWTNNLGDIL